MPAKQLFTAAQVVEALEKSVGIKTRAAARLGCHVNTIYDYCKRYPTVAAAAKAQDNTLVDLAESVTVNRLIAGEWDAAKFVLTTKGKDRGWGQSVDVHHKIDDLARQLAAEYNEPEDKIKAELIDLESERKRRTA